MTHSTLNRIERMHKLALPLEPGSEVRAHWLESVINYTDDFIQSIPDRPAFVPTDDRGIGILDSPISEEPLPVEQVLGLLQHHVDRPGENEGTSPGYLAYIPSGGLYAAALGDYIAAVTNRFVGLSFCSPGGAQIEPMLWRWMADFIGYPSTSAGDLTSGGSIANLSAIVTAREAHGLKSKDVPRAVVYLSDQTHHSVRKGLKIAGLGECILRHIPLDGNYRMRADSIASAIEADKLAGLLPWLVVATAGTTETGVVDPLESIAEVARHNRLWLHIDGAYGAMFALCDMGKEILSGIELGDSLTLDPHKGLFMSLGTGAVLVRDGSHLLKAFQHHASYLEGAEVVTTSGEISQSDLSPELTRPFRGLRLWLALKLTGVAPFRAALEEKLLLARCFYDKLCGLDGFVTGPPPDLSVVMFRYQPTRGDANEFNQKLIQAIQRDGRVFLSSTKIDGQVFLRLAVLGFRTHLETIELALEILVQKSKEIESGWNDEGVASRK